MSVLISLEKFRSAVAKKFGQDTANWHLWITSSQFHLMFYASRPLPNIFALALALNSAAYWLKGQHQRFILTSAFVILVFRAELALLLGPMLFMDLISKRVSLFSTIKYGLCGLCLALLATLAIDSVMWRQDFLWPEGQVLYYNVVLNKSSAWGVSPFLWYFYSALPRALFASIFFIPLGLYWDKRTVLVLLPSLAFVFVYSFLPHKELRFVIYVFPLLNVLSAEACKRICQNFTQKPSFFTRFLALLAIFHVILNFAFSALMLWISSHNYPGGQALMTLHEVEKTRENDLVKIHLDVYSAQTGISRFLQQNSQWKYDKTEDLNEEDLIRDFDFLLVQAGPEEMKVLDLKRHVKVGEILGFKGVTLVSFTRFPFLKVDFAPAVTILKRL